MHRISGWRENLAGYRIRQAEYPFIKKTGYPAKYMANNFLLLEKGCIFKNCYLLRKECEFKKSEKKYFFQK